MFGGPPCFRPLLESSVPKISLRKPLTIVITVEGLATSALGCYGCSWNSTPAIDSLAAGGTVWDRWITPIDQPAGLINQWLRGLSPKQETRGQSLFMTDSASLNFEAAELAFDSVTRLQIEPVDQPAINVSETSPANAFSQFCTQVSSQTTLAWLHLDSLHRQWDAPVETDLETDESSEPVEDPDLEPVDAAEPFQLPMNTAVPSLQRTEQDDPDFVFAWMQRYGAQVRLLDGLIDGLLEALHRRSPTIVLAGTSGFSLGQNDWIGHRVGPLRSNEIRLPLVITGSTMLRVPGLASAETFPDLLGKSLEGLVLSSPTDWCQRDEEFEPSIVTQSNRCHKAVTTGHWFYAQDQPHGDECLYLKPDDVEDMNNIARLRHDVIDRLSKFTASGE